MLVSVQEFQNYIRNDNFSADEAQSLLLATQAGLERYLNRPAEPVMIREALIPDADGYAEVSITPVWRVVNVAREGDAGTTPTRTDLPALSTDPTVERSWDPATVGTRAISSRLFVGLPGLTALFVNPFDYNEPPRVVVTYVAGYNGWNDEDMKLTIKQVAARSVVHNNDDTISLRDGAGQRAQDNDTREKGWTLEELQQFDRAKRRTVVGSPIANGFWWLQYGTIPEYWLL